MRSEPVNMNTPVFGAPPPPSIARPRGFERPVSLAEVLDRVLTKGAVVAGEVVISVAGIELVYLGLNVVLTSVETARSSKQANFQLVAAATAGSAATSVIAGPLEIVDDAC
jgi:hypothetical protein